MKRNTTFIFFVLLLLACLSGCSDSAEQEDVPDTLDTASVEKEDVPDTLDTAIDPEIRARLIAEDVMDSLELHSTEVLSDLLCDRLHRDHPKLDQEIREFYDFMDGSIVSYDEPQSSNGGKEKSSVFMRVVKEDEGVVVRNITTSSGAQYELYLCYTFVELEQLDTLRITEIDIWCAEAATDQYAREAAYEKGLGYQIALSDQEEVRVPTIRSDPFEDTSEWELRDSRVYHNGEMVHKLPDGASYDWRDLDASFIDSDYAYLAYFLWESEWEEERIVVESTWDGGAHWESVSIREQGKSDACLCLSFVEEKVGYLYYASGDIGDQIDALYITRDGGRSFKKAAAMNWGMSEWVMDMAFRTEEEGILLMYGDQYSISESLLGDLMEILVELVDLFLDFSDGSDDIYALHTTDGGQNWERIDFDEKLWDTSYVDNYYSYDYMSGRRLEREHMGSDRWVATLVGVKYDRAEYLHYVSDDGWKTWEKYPVSEERKKYGVFFDR